MEVEKYKTMCADCLSVSYLTRNFKRKTVESPCIVCGTQVSCQGRAALSAVRRGRVYCSEEHKMAYLQKSKSENMARTNEKHASVRMVRNNPMHRAEVRMKVSDSLRSMGWCPPVRGGKGKGLTAPQKLLADALGWSTETVIPTGKSAKKDKVASHYTLDIADLERKIAVEVDGGSHNALRVQRVDREKEAFLSGLGWRVLRFSNQEILSNLEDCLAVVRSTISK